MPRTMPTHDDDERLRARIKEAISLGFAMRRRTPSQPERRPAPVWRFGATAALAVVVLALAARSAIRPAPTRVAAHPGRVSQVVSRSPVTVQPKALAAPDSPWIQSLIGSVGWAIAESNPHLLLKSVTGGRTWVVAQTLPDPVTHVDFVNTADGYLTATGCASTCTLLEATTNGGATWTVVARGRQESWTGLDFTSPAAGYIAGTTGAPGGPGTYALWHTANGGRTMSRVADPCTGPAFGQSVSFSAGQGWLLCAGQPSAGQESKQLYRSRSGGRSWTLVTAAAQSPSGGGPGVPFSGYVGRLAAVSGSTAFMALNRGAVEATSSGGRSWTPVASLPINSDVATVGFSSPQEGWAEVSQSVGEVDIYATTNGGRRWSLRYPSVPPVRGLGAIGHTFYGLVPVAGGLEVWADLGSRGWSPAASLPAGLAGVSPEGITARGRTWVVYGGQHVHTSANAGRTWAEGKALPGYGPISASFSSVRAGWYVMAAANPMVLRTADGGAHWTTVTTPFSPEDVVAESSRTAWMMSQAGSGSGQYPFLWVTRNGGHTWKLLWQLPGHHLVGGFAAGGDGILASGHDIWTTTDGGARWTRRTLPLPHGVGGVEAAAISGSGALMIMVPNPQTGQNSIWQSTTHGASWTVRGRV